MRFAAFVFGWVLLGWVGTGCCAQTPDCLPRVPTWASEGLRGAVRSLHEREYLPDGSVWQQRQYWFDEEGYMVRELFWDTLRHLRHKRIIEYRRDSSGRLLGRTEEEFQEAQGLPLSERHRRSVEYQYDKNGRFFGERITDGENQDTLCLRFLYSAGGWIDACPVLPDDPPHYARRKPLYSYRYQRTLCLEKVDYRFEDHSRRTFFVCDSSGRLLCERRFYINAKGDTLAHFQLDYTSTDQGQSLNLSDYYQNTDYFDDLPETHRCTYERIDPGGNWLQKTVEYSAKQVHKIERTIEYYSLKY